ncbi:hypothetical protein Kpho02_28040 [Kitasatospora phosalacinea]|uniref:TPM domain-containing protein n=1 Tax=Kitasatospora phosalacinea TaxID=2065 RepID=A0A9W6V2Y4_9ACTN|nr:hypothetical protein [Kitasatospora phosalacinea]GLW70505.1 hypothetical protein Kpho02_28040 [Kitasatospora phosalacinea]
MRTQERIPDRRRPTARTAPGVALAATALAALVLLGTTAPTAAADPGPAPSASTGVGTGTPASGQLPAEAPQSERLAAELRKDPVYVSADLPRQVPRSMAPRFAAVAKRIGVPTYVLVLPDADRTTLAQVHDRLGVDGLYVLVEKYGGVTVSAFGVDLPAEAAARIANHEVSYDAGPLARFSAFADKVVQDEAQVNAEVEEIYRNHDDETPRQYISSTDRENQNLLLGLALVLLPGLLLALGLRLSRRRGTWPAPAPLRRPVPLGKRPVPLGKRSAVSPAKTGKGARTSVVKRPQPAGPAPAPLRRGVLAATLLAALAAALGVVLAAPAVFPQTIDDPDLTVTRADLDARATEAAAALAADGVYQDASAPNPLTTEQLAAVRQRVSDLAAKTPVHLLFTSSNSDDESEGDGGTLLAQVRRHTGRDGVYVQVDPVNGYLQLAEYGPVATDVERRFSRADLRYPDRSTDSDDLKLPERLNTVLDEVAAAQPTGRTGNSAEGSELPELRSNKLPPLFSNDFGPGLFLGALLLAVLVLLGWAAIAATQAVLRARRTRAADPSPAPSVTGPRRLAARPTARQLRSWAAEDARALAARLAAADQDAPGRARAWDCLDAAELLLGGDGGRTADPSDLAAAVALARAGTDALTGRPDPLLCRANPLHGAANGGKAPFWFASVDLGPKSARVCPDCRDAFRRSGADRSTADRTARRFEADQRLLRVPDPDGRSSTVWHEAGQVLPAALDGLDALILRARESASVQ